MSIDLLGSRACTHVSGKYLISNCPVCSGSGFYFDINLNQNGDLDTVLGLNKVVQGISHLITSSENQYRDYGYADYGSRLRKFIGSKNLSDTRLKFQVLKDLELYTKIKEAQQARFKNITADEVIQDVVLIDATLSSDTQSVKIGLRIGESDKVEFLNIKQINL